MLRVFGLNGSDAFNPDNVGSVINIEQWLRHLAVMNLLGNSETGLNSGYNDDYFMYRGAKDPRFILLYYDQDQILGFNGAFAPDVSLFTAANIGNLQRSGPAFGRFMRHPEFEPIYYRTLKNLIHTTFSEAEFNGVVDHVLGAFVPEATRSQIKSWMNARREYVLSQLPVLDSSISPTSVVTSVPRSQTPMTSAALRVGGNGISHYRFSLNGSPFGAAFEVSSPILLTNLPVGTNTLSVTGMNATGDSQREDEATVVSWEINPRWHGVRLNEILASREGGSPDQVEFFNESAVPQNLKGLRLTDKLEEPNRYTFDSVTIDPGAYLAMDAAQLGFSFDASGEVVYLLDTAANGGTILDRVEFGHQLEGSSIGRIASGAEWFLTVPSLGFENTAQQTGELKRIRINEWLASGTAPFQEDFVELYNPGDLPVGIGRATLSNHPLGAPARSVIRQLSFIAPRGHATFRSGDGGNADFLDFQLEADQGELALFSPALDRIDSIVYGPQVTGISQGRCPDGDAVLTTLDSPTPGSPNLCPAIAANPEFISLINFTNIWRYNLSGSNLGTTWRDETFDDSLWNSGPGLLGFESSVLPEPLRTQFSNPRGVITYYFRTSFDVDNTLAQSSLRLTHVIDDGAAFYINGQDIGSRYNLPLQAAAGTFASGTIGNASYQILDLPPGLIRPGLNVMSVEVHQGTRTSSDMVFGLKLEAAAPEKPNALVAVLINELFANSATGEAYSDSPDWVEIFNPSDTTHILAGMSLTDDAANPTRWIFPNDAMLLNQSLLRIQFDPKTSASHTNTGFGLKSESGKIYLFAPLADGGGLVDSVAYGLQPGDWSLARTIDAGEAWSLGIPTPAQPNIPATLGDRRQVRINEWMAAPVSGSDWFEIFNPNDLPVDIGELWLSDDLNSPSKHLIPPLSYLGTGAAAYLRFEADGSRNAGAAHVSFSLNAGGESLAISEPNGALIDGIGFGPQVVGVSLGRLPDGSPNVVNFEGSPTPGSGNFLPLKTVFINEVLSHSEPPLEDAIELHNASNAAVEIGGWYLSDSAREPRKFQVPANTLIPPRGYTVFYEYQFHAEAAQKPFSLSATKGGTVFLTQAVDGVLNGYRAFAPFGAAENGVSFGRFETSNSLHFIPMASRSFGVETPSAVEEFRMGSGLENPYARIGPVVINEIMYHPQGTNAALEYLELHNITSADVSLFDSLNPKDTWRIRKGIDFEFAAGTLIPPGGYLVVVSFSPEEDPMELDVFQREYGSHPLLVGPYRGRLNNGGEAIELLKADTPIRTPGPELGFTPYVVVDRVDYLNTAPWPETASRSGFSIQKLNSTRYGNDPAEWIAAEPNPGVGRFETEDSDGDGLSDDWETANGLNPNDPFDADIDSDRDGLTNHGEYLAGTDPLDPVSLLQAHLELAIDGGLIISFNAAPKRSYVIEFREFLSRGEWKTLTEVKAGDFAREFEISIDDRGMTGFLRISVLSTTNYP